MGRREERWTVKGGEGRERKSDNASQTGELWTVTGGEGK